MLMMLLFWAGCSDKRVKASAKQWQGSGHLWKLHSRSKVHSAGRKHADCLRR